MGSMDGLEIFSTRNVDCDHRVRYWNMVVATTFPGMEVQIPGQAFAGELQRWSLGEIGLMRAAASRSRVLRLAQCDVGEWAVLHVIRRGYCHVSDGRRSVRAGAGDLIVCDPGRPYTIDVSDRNDCLIAQVPTALMPAVGSCVDSHVSMFSGGDARVALFRHYLTGLWDYGQSLEEGSEEIMRILAAMASTTLQGAAQRELDGDAPGTLAMLVDHVRRNLGDPELGTATLAAMSGKSPRAVQKAFAQVATSPSAYIRRERLNRAAAMLRDHDERSITSIAFDLGFSDSAFFSRCFRQQFDMTPLAWRRRHQQ